MNQQDPNTVQAAVQGDGWSGARQWRWVALLAVVALAGAGAYALLHRSGEGPATPVTGADERGFRPTQAQLKSLAVEAVALHPFQAEEQTDGKIALNADRTTAVYSPYSGRVTRVVAGPGDLVAAGAPLAYVEASEFAQAQSDLHGAAAAATLARLNESRKHALYDAKGGSLQDWQQAQADLIAAEATVTVARNKLAILGLSAAQIDELEHGKASAAAPLVPLLAPLAGVVVDRQVGPGQFLQAGAATPVYTVADVGTVWVVANVREATASKVRRGQAIEVRVAAYPDRVYSARVTFVAPTVDPATHRVAVRAEIDNRSGALKPEMFATFRILTGGAAQSPGVPDSAVVYEGSAAHVWVVRPDGSVELRAVVVGRVVGGYAEIVDGLKVGERIVTKGSLFIDRAARAE